MRTFDTETGFFHDRRDAGERLARVLAKYRDRNDVLVLALPRGGVPVGFEVARRLGLPLDILVVRKLGVPHYPEVAMGAVAGDGTVVLNKELLGRLSVTEDSLREVAHREILEIRRRERVYRGERAEPEVKGRTIILVDDGIATGSTMKAAVKVLRAQGASRIVVAVPVAAYAAVLGMASQADELICLLTPEEFGAVGLFYRDFSQTTDAEVCRFLNR